MQKKKGNIVWLASYPKSGNTWFRIFLSNLLSKSDKAIQINQLDLTSIASNRNILDEYLGMNTSNLTHQEIDLYLPEIYNQISIENNNPVFIKTHDAWRRNNNGLPIFSDESTYKVLYFIRNPLDITVSFSYHSNIPIQESIRRMNYEEFGLCTSIKKISNQIHQVLFDWSRHVVSWTKESNLTVKVVRYEDMIEYPLETFGKALDFLNIEYTKSKLVKSLSNSSFSRLRMQEEKYGFREKNIESKFFFRSGIVNDWRSHLGSPQVQEILTRHKAIMKEYGYLKDL